MRTRRGFVKALAGLGAGIGFFFHPLWAVVRSVYGGSKRAVLPGGTDPASLVEKNPAEVDARNLAITPLDEFETMGLTNHRVLLPKWRLAVTGHLERPLQLSYEEILALPSIERPVLLICPGVFVIHGRWRGFSARSLLEMGKAKEGVTHITFKGPPGEYEKVERFDIKETLSDKVFLAHHVNGKPLPGKHGFPLRLVAEDQYGFRWVKFVQTVTVDKL
jgi:sulfoxide reductase catalytic subunit YedY